jgi:type IV pilus assembly protein PilO
MEAKDTVINPSGNTFVEKIEKLTLWQRVSILVGVLVLALLTAGYFLYLPQYEEITSLEEKLKGLEKKLATAKVNAAELEKFQAKMQEAETKFKIALRALPEKEEIPSLLTSVSKSGQEVGLEFLLFEPKGEAKKEFYAEIPVAMNIRGDYHNLAIFFDKVARLSRIVNIVNITIDRGKEGRDLNTTCTAVTYKFVEPVPEKTPPGRPVINKPAEKGDAEKHKKTKKLDM